MLHLKVGHRDQGVGEPTAKEGDGVVGGVHVGAVVVSGLVYGWLAYLIVRGLFNRSFGQVIVVNGPKV